MATIKREPQWTGVSPKRRASLWLHETFEHAVSFVEEHRADFKSWR